MSAPPADAHAAEIAAGERFRFGENWRRFLAAVDEPRIARAQRSLQDMLGVADLAGRTFLDIGSGSGLFSLAARRLGATVRSFDYDPDSVACAHELRRRYRADDAQWTIERGSALDAGYMRALGAHDVVYSWGVLHHTGAMWQGVDLAAERVAPGGQLFIALYNDQGRPTRRWRLVKRAYCALPRPLKPLVLLPCAVRLWAPTILRDTLRLRPFASWRSYGSERGMSPWRDVVDWVGGYPFEVARPEEPLDRLRPAGFTLERLRTCGGGLGCNEWVFRRAARDA
jgi:2-polyprenyl-6-hydroxyphenyl methylase/3-demethylubiquinone-9 3-methyltransferase